MVMGMADLPKSWEADLRKLWEGLMPLYGLNADEADVWMELFDVTLPMRGSFEMSFSDGVRFAGFYDILDAPAAAVYEKWLNVTGGMATGDDGFYKDFAIKRAHREIDGLKVDSISFAMNPENPAMELPEQKAMMEQMFPGGKMTYEMAIKDERIYMATEGKLDRLLSAKPGKAPPVEINEHTRFAVSYNFLAFMKLGMSASDAPGMPDFSKMDTEGTSVGYAFDISDRLVLRSAFPLKLISVFTQMMMPADPAI